MQGQQKKITPARVWSEFNRLHKQNQSDGLYDNVQKNENFFVGKQWEGVNAPNLDKPVMNILKPTVSYQRANIVSDNIAASVTSTGRDEESAPILKIVNDELRRVMENCKTTTLNHDFVRDAAVDGDCCAHVYFDPSIKNEHPTPGEIVVERLENTNVLFGNPQVWEVSKQPFIIIRMRKMLADARREAVEEGMHPEEARELIQADSENGGLESENDDDGGKRVTVLIRYWLENDPDGTPRLWSLKCTQNAILRSPRSLGYRCYPIAWMCWEKVKNSYHGQASVTGMIPNQIFINKLFAMCMEHVKTMAFPKIVYDRQKLKTGWDNTVGQAIGVDGPPESIIATSVRGQDMSAQVIQFIDKTMATTRETMGATDAALGNVRPDNTSAIIAVQKASSAPLEIQRMAFYQFVEDYVRVFLEIMRTNYGTRIVYDKNEMGETTTAIVDFGQEMQIIDDKPNVDIGPATYWSELMHVQTLDNLFEKQIISPLMYLKSLPSGYIPNRDEITRELEARQQEQEAMQEAERMAAQMAAQGGGLQTTAGGGVDIAQLMQQM